MNNNRICLKLDQFGFSARKDEAGMEISVDPDKDTTSFRCS